MATRQQEKSRQTQEELLTAAMQLFQEKGFFATTVAEITERAGYAKGSLYRHWSGKDEMVLQIIERKLTDYRKARAERLEAARSLEDVLDAIWDFLDTIVEDESWSRVFLEFTVHASRDPQLRTRLSESAFRLSDEVFAGLVGDFVRPGADAARLGALNTALFEGFLIHNILGTGRLRKDEMREAAKKLALDYGPAK